MCLFSVCVPCGIACMQCKSHSLIDHTGLQACACACFLGCIGQAINRSQLRQKLNIEGGFVQDLCCSCCCACCAVNQEWRETMIFKFKDETRSIFNASEAPPPQPPKA
mmetsp:Transcript_21865/g.21590  ORF Transcript_21865/g.21590 Transcript_21865/m.21590 type:complete len:108 (+) Transcript_21865:65-388(+)